MRRLTLLASAALAPLAEAPALRARSAIVIGSGFGGAVAACRLAQAGMAVTVLERGRRWDVNAAGTTFCKRITRGAGLIQKHAGDGIQVVCGAGVGGGSLVIGMFMPQPRRADWESVYRLPYSDFENTYWPRARRNLGAAPIPADIQDHASYAGARAWLSYLAEFGKAGEPVPFGVDWDVIRAELAGRAPACHTIGEGPFGSNSGAKNSVDKNYLARATAAGARILPLHEVTEIREVPGSALFEVACRQIDDRGTVLSTPVLTADYVFLAAGSLGSTSLLLTSKARGRLPRLVSTEAGKGWGNNGDFLVARLNLRKTVGHAQGGPGNVRFHDDSNPYAEMETSSDKAGRDLASRLWWATEGSKGSLLTGLPSYDRNTGMGLGSRNTYHPLGGLVMGRATDFGGKVDGYPNLFCVDGALLPGSAALANPALTITANAERCMDLFLASATNLQMDSVDAHR